jgi:hypothetical protein
MNNIIHAPSLNVGQFSLLQTDVNTGHVLQTNGELYIGKGEFFKLFNNLSEVQEYIEKQISKNNNLEFVIYDCNGKGILLINRFERKSI